MLTRLPRYVVYRRQSKASVFGTTSHSISLLQPFYTASISTNNRHIPLSRLQGISPDIPARRFASSTKDVENEALAIEEIEPIEAFEEATEKLSLTEDEVPLEEVASTKKSRSKGKDKITGVSRGSDDKARSDRQGASQPKTELELGIEGLKKTREYLRKMFEEEQVLYNEHVSRRDEDEDFNIASYLEHVSQTDVLKQVVTNPDYQARDTFLGQASPKAASIQEEKARALSKLAAYNKSADILKLIKNRMGSDKEMQRYLVDELSKTGSDLATFMASEIKMGDRKLKDIQAHSEISAIQAQHKKDLETQNDLKRPIDSFNFGVAKKFGENAFAPANKIDRLEKHDKNRINSFKEYKSHLDKIGLKAQETARLSEIEKYDELFERYQIPQADRKYIFLSDLEKMDPLSDDYRKSSSVFAKLIVKIPELYFEATQPTTDDFLENSLREFHRNEMIELSHIEAARQPYIEKQLKELRVKFDKQTSSMSEADREIAWAKIEQEHYQQIRTDFDERTQLFWSKAQGRLEDFRRSQPGYQKTPAEIMANLKYQKIKDSSSSPLSIDRVTLDGPRDLIGELKETLNQGPVYDLNKNPGSTVLTEVESAFIDGRKPYEAEQAPPKNPVDDCLQKIGGLRIHLEENYDYAKQIESAIDTQRKKMALDLLEIKAQLAQVQTRKGSLQKLVHEQHIKEIEQQVLPNQNLYDFIEFEANEATQNRKTLLQDELNQLLKSQTPFDPQSKEPQAYEQELKVLSQHALLNLAMGKPNDQLQHFLYVFGQIKANQVSATTQIHARMFEFSVLSEKPQVANDLLVDLTKDRSEALSPIDPRFLRIFFDQSLKRDNLDGVAHLVNYSERYGTDMSNYPINNFRSALDYYLNKKFDLSKVMIFLNFYQKHFSDRARNAFGKIEATEQVLSNETIHAVSKQIFGKSDGLVDLSTLFDYFVQSTGKRQVIDPFTNEDSLWKLIESQTMDKDFIRAAQMSGNCHIGGRSVAVYLGNQFERASSFDRTFRTALRLEGTPMADSFFKEIIQQLNAYSLSNRNQLPRSFTEKNLTDLYLRLKLSGAQLSHPMSELLLYSLNKKEMHREIVDYCTAEERINSDVEKYYLAESLLQGKIKDKSYSTALRKSKIFDSNENLSACQLTLKTKALFLDGSPQTAIDTFKKDLLKREEQAAKRKDLMVALFDNVMPADRELSFEEFKEKHQKSALFSRRIVAQAYAVSTLQKIVKNNDYDGIDNAFNLYMVMRQEQEITNEKFILDDQGNLTQISKSRAKLSKDQLEKLDKLRQRKAHLQKMLHIEDYQRIKELLEISKGEKIELMAGLDHQGLQKVLDIFRDMSFEEAIKYSSAEGESSSKRAGRSNKQKITSKTDQFSKNTEKTEEPAGEESEIDWFEAFAKQKESRKQKAYAEVILENSKPIFDKVKKDNLAQHWAVLANKEQNFAKMMAGPTRQKYLQALDNWVEKNIKKTEQIDPSRLQAEQEMKRLEELDKFFEKIQEGVDLDPVREAELSLKVQLDAKINVLKNELQENRFPQEFDEKNNDEAHNYAKAIALLRLEAKQLEKKLAHIRRIPKTKITQPFYRALYNISSEREEEAAIKNYEVLMTENDPHAILDHFSKGSKLNREQFLRLDENLAKIQILPDAYKEIEEKALKSAQKAFEIRQKMEDAQSEVGYEEEDNLDEVNDRKGKKKSFLSKNVKIDENSSWTTVLKQSEILHQKQVYDHYYIGRQRANEDEPYSHPRELLDDIQSQELSDDARGERIIRRLGLEMPDEEESDDEIRDEMEKDAIEDKIIADMLEKQRNVLRHPLEYFERMHVRESLDQMRSKQLRDFVYENEKNDENSKNMDALVRFNNRMLNDGIDPHDNNDPINYLRYAHDASLMDLKEGLTKAVGERKAHALPLAIQIFNRIQEKTVKVTKLDDFNEDSEKSDENIQKISESLDKFEILLNDSSSPILSNLRSTSKYTTQKLPETLDEYRSTVKNGDILKQPVDLNQIINDYRSLSKTEDHLANIKQTLNKAEKQLKAKQEQVRDRVFKTSFDKFVEDAKKETQDSQDAYLRRLYTEYKQAGKDGSKELSRDQKVHLMRDIFRVELGEEFINTEEGKADSSFPAFYALDLIKFGLNREIPAAIRLGELLLTENCANHSQAVMPRELAKAVKDYMLENQEQYQAAAQFTGPINNTQIYHQARQTNGGDAVFFTMDDPYWQQFMQKNYRREDNWRAPSIFVWDHKPYGILGEVLDLKRFEKTLREQEIKL